MAQHISMSESEFGTIAITAISVARFYLAIAGVVSSRFSSNRDLTILMRLEAEDDGFIYTSYR